MVECRANVRVAIAGLTVMALGAGAALVGCNRSGEQTVILPRSQNATVPSTQQDVDEEQEQVRKDLDPIPELGPSVAEKMPDGDVWTKYTKSGLMIYELRPGLGIRPQMGQTVHVYYKGTFPNGIVFDETQKDPVTGKGTPFTFVLGTKNIIKGWNLALSTMSVGGKRKIYLPANLAYGTGGSLPLIHPNQDLLFEIELLDVTGKIVNFPEPKVPATQTMGPTTHAAAADNSGTQPAK
jgi:FKBP-type peptidyl-prolyl cis-trans isomerase